MRTSHVEPDKSKSRAKAILSRLRALGFSAGLQQAYELLAAADGHRNWATMKAVISSDSRQRLDCAPPKPFSSEDEYTDLVQEMLESDGNSVNLNAKVYEALGYTIEWRMCKPGILESIFDNTPRPRPFIVTRPALISPIKQVDPNDASARRADAKRRSETSINGDLLPITVSIDEGMVLFNGLKAFESCSLSINYGPGVNEVSIVAPSGQCWTSTAKTVAMALCVTMVRMLEGAAADQ